MKISCKEIDIDSWSRKETYLGFLKFQTPHINVDFDLNIGNSFEKCREKNISFFDFILYHCLNVANEIENFRYRIRDEKPIVHSIVHPDWVVMNDDKSIQTRCSEYSHDFEEFCFNRRHHSKKLSFGEDEYLDHLIFTSCTPWLDFTAITQPCSTSNDCIPKLVWGKCRGDKLRFSIQVHHSLMDAWHIAQFKDLMENNILESLSTLT